MAHLKMRSRCIDYFAQVYGMMPLKAVEFRYRFNFFQFFNKRTNVLFLPHRANPVLFRDNIPDKLKEYTMIGTL